MEQLTLAEERSIDAADTDLYCSEPRVPLGVHYGCTVDERGYHRVVILRDHARAPEMLPEKFKNPRDAIRRSDELEESRGR